MITEDAILYLNSRHEQLLRSLTVQRLLAGKNFTAVQLSDQSCGLAGNEYFSGRKHTQTKDRYFGRFAPGNFSGADVYELLNFNTDSRIPDAVKIAVINAVSSGLLQKSRFKVIEDADTLDIIGLRGKKTISVVGAFHNYIKRLQETEHQLHVIELNEEALKDDQRSLYVPFADSKDILSKSDIVLITGSSIINRTLDTLLSMCSKDSVVALVGPSGGMLPEVLFEKGVSVIGTTRITDPEAMFLIIGEGGSGYHLFEHCAQKICIINDKISF